MKEYEGNFHRYKNSLPYAAIVKISVEKSEINSITIDCNGDGWIRQGYLESVPAKGYDDWKEGAIIGINYALRKTRQNFKVTVTEILGMITDTSPSSVAAAAIYALWKAIEFVPTETDIERIEKVVFESGYNELPNFDRNEERP